MPIIPMQGDLRGDALEREAAAWTHAILCEPGVRQSRPPQIDRKQKATRPPAPQVAAEAMRAYLADGFSRMDIGETARALHDRGQPSAGLLAQSALGYEGPIFCGQAFAHTADQTALLQATGRAEREVILAAHVVAFLLVVGVVDPARATLDAALKAFRVLWPDYFRRGSTGYARRVWDRHEPAAPIALAHVVGLLGPRRWNPVRLLLAADAIVVRLVEIDQQRPARRLFGDRDVFWRPPPGLVSGTRVRLQPARDPALADAVRRGEVDPVRAFAGDATRSGYLKVEVTPGSQHASVELVEKSDEIENG